ncbi:hypothetical protein DL771_004422 [Monosporascus sp. 5C6A]|nr:hypothetical protein DL771_004422 [Monosporascus sp. 5C6A]
MTLTATVKNPHLNSCLSPGGIRLLQLLPHGNKHAPIQCRLFCTLLDSEGTRPYEALSYVWGSEDKPRSISIDEYDLAIGTNLYAALLHLRDRSIERTIWTDAICINQEDPEEKGQQVQSMAKIYAKASRVIVWLGEAAAGSDQALEEIRSAAELSTKPSVNETGILPLLQRPWFQRIWVLQEAAAARHVLIKCGSTEIDGFAFCSGLNALNLSYEPCPNLPALIRSVTYLIRGAIFRPRCATGRSGSFSLNIRPLCELVEMYYTRRATDLRDKVYALLGMSSDDPTAAKLSPDYTISWGELFKKLIHFVLSELMSVDTWDDKEIAVIKGKGCILGEVSSVEKDPVWEDTQHVGISWKDPVWEDTQHVGISWKNAPSHSGVKEAWNSRWTFQTSVKSVQGQWTLLCLAAGNGYKTLVKLLLNTGKVDFYAKELQTALWLAGENGHEAVVKLLLDTGKVDPDITDGYGQTALWLAGEKGHEAVVKLLLDTGKADPDITDGYGWTALYLAAGNGHKAVVKLLLDTGKVNPDAKDRERRTALWLAAAKGHEAVVKLLLDTGKVDLDAKDTGGQTALYQAAKNGHEAVVKLLLDTGKVDLDAKDREGRTALQWAEKNGHETVVKLLQSTMYFL